MAQALGSSSACAVLILVRRTVQDAEPKIIVNKQLHAFRKLFQAWPNGHSSASLAGLSRSCKRTSRTWAGTVETSLSGKASATSSVSDAGPERDNSCKPRVRLRTDIFR